MVTSLGHNSTESITEVPFTKNNVLVFDVNGTDELDATLTPSTKTSQFAPSKIKTISSSSETVPIENGNLLIGEWKQIFVVELDPIRDRTIICTFIGE